MGKLPVGPQDLEIIKPVGPALKVPVRTDGPALILNTAPDYEG